MIVDVRGRVVVIRRFLCDGSGFGLDLGFDSCIFALLGFAGTLDKRVDFLDYQGENEAAALIYVITDRIAVVDVAEQLRIDNSLVFGLEG